MDGDVNKLKEGESLSGSVGKEKFWTKKGRQRARDPPCKSKSRWKKPKRLLGNDEKRGAGAGKTSPVRSILADVIPNGHRL